MSRRGNGPAAGGGEKCVGVVERGAFCPENPCVDDALRELYELPDPIARDIGMDCYIYLCGVLSHCSRPARGTRGPRFVFGCICGSPEHSAVLCRPSGVQALWFRPSPVTRLPLSSLVLCDEDAPQYARLPDLTRHISAVLQKHHVAHLAPEVSCLRGVNKGAEPAKVGKAAGSARRAGPAPARPPPLAVLAHGMCCTILQESIPCLKRCKRSNRPMQFVRALCVPTEVSSIINCMHGTLLGLYPRAVRTQTFPSRVELAWRIREIMSLTTDKQIDFIERNMGVVRLCLMEYCNNAVPDLMGPEHAALSKMQPGIEAFEGVCSSVCNGFRRSVLATGSEPWETINWESLACMERCVRMCRFKVPRPVESGPKQIITPGAFDPRVLGFLDMYGCISSMRQAERAGCMGPGVDDHMLRVACSIQRSVRCFELPQWVGESQWRAVGESYGGCIRRVEGVCTTHICLVCATNGKGAWQPLRMCTETGDLGCTTCKARGTVVGVNMVGRILRVLDASYYLCPRCLRVVAWRGDGTDLRCGYETGVQCRCGDARRQEQERQAMGTCAACAAKHISSPGVSVVSTDCRRVDTLHLCSRHMPHPHMLKGAFDRHSLEAAVRARALKQGTRWRLSGGGGGV